MKRNDDLIRSLLFEAEAADSPSLLLPETNDMSDFELERVEHARLLCDASYFEQRSGSGYRMTNSGHDYLAAIRDDTVWKKTKDGAAKAGGVSLSLMGDIALEFVKQKVAEKTGLNL